MYSPLHKILPSIRSMAGAKASKRWVTAAAMLGMISLGVCQADAGFSSIRKSKTASEANQEQILEHVYGGDFVKNGNDYSNGTVTATREDDSTDQVWNTDITSARALAAFARKRQSFGIDSGASGDTFQKLFDVTGRDFAATGSSTVTGEGSSFRVARGGQNGSKPVYTSLNADNSDGRDHVVSYKLSGGGTNGKFVLFFEDLAGNRSDFDYNDLVVEASTAGSSAVLIPLPAAAWSGLTGLLGLGVMAGFKKARKLLS